MRITDLSQQAERTPQDAIYSMMDAARAGDVNGYFASYTGEMAQAMKARECSIFRLRKVLRDSDAGLKGIAVMEPQPQSDRTVKLRVEYVYQDRNEAQTFLLEKQKRAGDFPYGIV